MNDGYHRSARVGSTDAHLAPTPSWPSLSAAPARQGDDDGARGLRPPGGGRSSAIRVTAFAIGDAALLVVVALAGTWVMHLVHQTGVGLLAATLLGMTAAMLVQIVLATAVAPLLGSIESMVPSAVVGMTVPGLVCLLTFVGMPWHRSTLYTAAALVALAFSLWTKVYAWQCRRRFRQGVFPGTVGVSTAERASHAE